MGKSATLEKLAAARKPWSCHHPRRSWPSLQTFVSIERPLQWAALDATDALREARSGLTTQNYLVFLKDETQHEVWCTLVQMFGDRILGLASSQGKVLILPRQQVEKCKVLALIGIYPWSVEEVLDGLFFGCGISR